VENPAMPHTVNFYKPSNRVELWKLKFEWGTERRRQGHEKKFDMIEFFFLSFSLQNTTWMDNLYHGEEKEFPFEFSV
jgi:hypothetical protein